MNVTARRVVLFLIGLFLAVAVIGYGSVAFHLTSDPKQAQDASAPAPAGDQQASAPASGGESGSQPSLLSPSGVTPPTPETPSAEQPGAAGSASVGGVTVPSFDVLRVEPDGSTVVAGRAAPGSSIELVSGATIVGKAVAGPSGDFAIILEEPLEPGDHSLVLRATGEGGVATSMETAIVSVPKDAGGQVLAMVEQPGQPSRLITVPEAPAGGSTGQGAASAPAATQPEQEQVPASAGAGTTDQAGHQAAATASQGAAQPATNGAAASTGSETMAAAEPQTAPASANPAAGGAAPAVEAIEIEGSKVFVAGRAAAGSKLRIYANDQLLGEVTATPDGRFLLEGNQDLPVGSYTVRVDVLGLEGSVTARAAVPFEREPGENVAAVAPVENGAGAASGTTTGNGSSAGATSAAPAGSEAPAAPSAERLSGSDTASAGSETATAPALKAAQGAVIIRRGDSLWRISRRAYGQGVRYSTIYLANQDQIQNPNRIWPGQVFRMPESTPEGDKADMNKLGDQATTQP